MKVRLANLNEIVNIKKFIDNNWKKSTSYQLIQNF